MSEYAPPTGPPPPKVPEGWKVVWNNQYSEWFYVNIYTKKSQWDKPTEPVYPPGEGPPDGPPPSYGPPASGASPRTSTEKPRLGSNNPYAGEGGGATPKPDISEDERLARQLQEEEEARARAHGGDHSGLANSYYSQPGGTPQPGQYGYGQQSSSPYLQSQNPYSDGSTQDKGKSKGGFLGKLLGKAHGSGSKPQYGYPSQQPGYGPQHGQSGYGAPGAGYYGGQPGYYQQQAYGHPGRKPGSGMGVGGAAALGVGGGLLGGALLGEAMADAGDHGGDTYVENNYGDDGGDFGGDGGDFGGGDFGGGDF